MTLPDGRQLEYLVTGPPGGPVLVFHSGTPEPAVDFSGLTGPATALGLRTVSYSRPGYGRSTEHLGRSIGDAAGDVAALLDHLGAGEFLTLGWSGGGPHALACAALLPTRCKAASTLACGAPYPSPGLDFMAGMDQDTIDDWNLAIAGFDALETARSSMAAYFREATGASLAADSEKLLSSADIAVFTGTFADELASAFRWGMQSGIAGWRDDDLAFVKDWGFALSEITVPVAVWHGRQDRAVPFGHGEWLATAIPGAEAHLTDHDGHLTYITQFDEILADLVALVG
jgi:pimeloyl-ACP methyl ester carboxylesterase